MTVFGGMKSNDVVPMKECVRTFDTLRPQSGWTLICLDTPFPKCGAEYGLLNFAQSDSDENHLNFLVFGGRDEDDDAMDGCMVFQGNLPALEDGTLQQLSKQPEVDQSTEERLIRADYFPTT
jgi:hypothetical protein